MERQAARQPVIVRNADARGRMSWLPSVMARATRDKLTDDVTLKVP